MAFGFGDNFFQDVLKGAGEPIRDFISNFAPDPLQNPMPPPLSPSVGDVLNRPFMPTPSYADPLRANGPDLWSMLPDPLQNIRAAFTYAPPIVSTGGGIAQAREAQQGTPPQAGQEPQGAIGQARAAQAQAAQSAYDQTGVATTSSQPTTPIAAARAAAGAPAATQGSGSQATTGTKVLGLKPGVTQTHASPYLDSINRVAEEEGVPALYLAALMDTENSGPSSVSSAGARGLMQVIPGQKDWMGRPYVEAGEDARDPETSIRQGARALRDKYHYTGSWDAAVGAYFGYGTDAGGMTTGRYQQIFQGHLANYQIQAIPAPAPAQSTAPASQEQRTDVLTIQDANGQRQEVPRWYWDANPPDKQANWTVVNARNGQGRVWTKPDGTPFRPEDVGAPPLTQNTQNQSLITLSAQPGQSPAETVDNTPPKPPQGGVPSLKGLAVYQYGNESLATGAADYICGPIAAQAFVRQQGRNPTLQEALDLGRKTGVIDTNGMHGIESTASLIRSLGGVATVGRADPQRMAAEVQAGRGVIVNTRGHYFFAEDYDPKTGRFDFGNSARALRKSGGNTWYTLDELANLGQGAPAGAIYAGY
jgi:hypothetical protein